MFNKLFGKKEKIVQPESPKKEKVYDAWTGIALQNTIDHLPIDTRAFPLENGEITIVYGMAYIGKKNTEIIYLPIIQKTGTREEIRKNLTALVDSLTTKDMKHEDNRSKQTPKRRRKKAS
jgi:hypothetical protein